jgi:Angiotensin-converting enzyme
MARYLLSDAKDEHSRQFVLFADAMEAMTGQRDVLATPLLNYFEPLRVWLEAKNAENNEFIGWVVANETTTSAPVETTKSSAWSNHISSGFVLIFASLAMIAALKP